QGNQSRSLPFRAVGTRVAPLTLLRVPLQWRPGPGGPAVHASCAVGRQREERERMERTVSVELGGRTHSLQHGKIARLAGGSAVIQYGGTVVLVAATADKKPVQKDFVPLTVDYRERS